MPDGIPTCPQCGADLPAHALGGLCPRCVVGALRLSHILQGSFSAEAPEPASEEAFASEAQALTSQSDYLEPGERVGLGGMGEVRTARDRKLDRTLAVKRLRPERERQPGAVARFLAEARIAATLEHPGIAPIHDVGIDAEGHPFYTMRLVKGERLTEVLERLAQGDEDTVKHHPLATLLGIFQQVCDAVAYAHSRGVIHRDLKPDNIMLGEFGQVVVMDWGLAKVLPGEDDDGVPATASGEGGDPPEVHGESDISEVSPSVPSDAPPTRPGKSPGGPLTQDNVVMGSLGYMPPEQAGGRARAADFRADVYALGAILYHILTLRPPIRGRDERLLLNRTTDGDIRPPTDFNPGGPPEVRRVPLLHCPGHRVPGVLSAIARKALATAPEERYPSVSDLQSDVTAWRNGYATSVDSAGRGKQAALFVRRHRTFLALVSSTLAIVVIVAAVSFWRVSHTLGDLRAAAPAFAAEARALLGSQNLEPALERIRHARTLRPDVAEYQRLEANLLQSLLRLEEARDAFAAISRSSPEDVLALTNAVICSELLRARAGRPDLPADAIQRLRLSLLDEGRVAEAAALVTRVEQETAAMLSGWESQLAAAGVEAKLRTTSDGGVELDASRSALSDLAPIRGMVLTRLKAGFTSIADLSPLAGMRLTRLDVQSTSVKDLSPLAGMPLTRLVVSLTKVSDFAPLRDMPLRDLIALEVNVKDLTPLHGLPLKYLNLFGCRGVEDLSPLRGMALDVLDVYWSRVQDLEPLEGMPLWSLNLDATRVSDVTPLKGMPLTNLQLVLTPVSDLTPLRGMLLESLHLSGTRVSDLGPLRGMPLKRLLLDDCHGLTDVSPLADCRELEELTLPVTARDIEFLRSFPRLEKLNYGKPSSGDDGPTAAEFWQAYDARKEN